MKTCEMQSSSAGALVPSLFSVPEGVLSLDILFLAKKCEINCKDSAPPGAIRGPQKGVPPVSPSLPTFWGCQQPPGRPGSWPSSPAGCQRPSVFSCGLVLELDKIFQTNNWIVKGISCHRTVWEGRGGKEERQPQAPGAAQAAGPGAAAQPPPVGVSARSPPRPAGCRP